MEALGQGGAGPGSRPALAPSAPKPQRPQAVFGAPVRCGQRRVASLPGASQTAQMRCGLTSQPPGQPPHPVSLTACPVRSGACGGAALHPRSPALRFPHGASCSNYVRARVCRCTCTDTHGHTDPAFSVCTATPLVQTVGSHLGDCSSLRGQSFGTASPTLDTHHTTPHHT